MSKNSAEQVLSDESINWEQVAGEMRWALPGHACKYTKTRKGFWGNKWGCGRKINSEDRCEETGPNKKECRSHLKKRFEVDKDGAERIIGHLKNLGYITTYTCGAVFYDVPTRVPEAMRDLLEDRDTGLARWSWQDEEEAHYWRDQLRYPRPGEGMGGGLPKGPGGLPLPPIGPDGKPRY